MSCFTYTVQGKLNHSRFLGKKRGVSSVSLKAPRRVGEDFPFPPRSVEAIEFARRAASQKKLSNIRQAYRRVRTNLEDRANLTSQLPCRIQPSGTSLASALLSDVAVARHLAVSHPPLPQSLNR